MSGLRPRVELLTAGEVQAIVDDALHVLETVGFEAENREALELLRGGGVRIDGPRAFADEHQVRRALATTPARIEVFDRDGQPALDLGGDRVHFDPGSAAIFILDSETGRRRAPLTADLCRLAWVAESCRHLAAQSTALVPSDVPEAMGDRFRLYVALLSSRKPVVTGTFRTDGFAVMRDMLAAVRGGEAQLAAKPLAIFDCCPSPPLSDAIDEGADVYAFLFHELGVPFQAPAAPAP